MNLGVQYAYGRLAESARIGAKTAPDIEGHGRRRREWKGAASVSRGQRRGALDVVCFSEAADMICRALPSEVVSGLMAGGNGAQRHRETASPVREAEVVSGGKPLRGREARQR